MPNFADAALPVPKQWARSIQSALLHVIALAKYAFIYTRSWAGNSSSARVRLAAKGHELEQEVALFREEIRIKDSRMARISARQRPHYQPTERLAILDRAARSAWLVYRANRQSLPGHAQHHGLVGQAPAAISPASRSGV